MGNALVMFTTPEEMLWLQVRASGLTPPAEAVWRPPAKPWREHRLECHKDPVLRRAHLKAVRESLATFLNGHLARLNHMVRTGWFVLGKVRVRVAECRPVPEHGMRRHVQCTRRLFGPKAPPKAP